MRTGFEAMRLGAVAYIVPFVFVYSPALLLIGSFGEVTLAVVTAIAGTALLAVALSGFLFRPVGWAWRAALTLAGVALLIPPVGPIAWSEALNIAGAAVGVVFVGVEWAASRRSVAPLAAPDRP